MKLMGSSLFAVATVLLAAPVAQAQDTNQPEMLPEAVTEGEQVDDAYEMGTGNDSGSSTIEREEIKARAPGSGDVNQLLKILPTVQFSRDEGIASLDNILDLRPANISISGGRIYNNLITLDGIDVGSRLDITNDNAFNGSEPAGNSAQTLWLDSNLIGEITLRDSNVSAEYGSFTGGALEIKTRAPMREFGAQGYVHYTSDELTAFNMSDATREAFGDDPLPEKPEFRKWRFGGSIDVPVSQDVALLFAASRQVAHVTNFHSAAYGGTAYDENSESNNFLVSGIAELGADLTLKGKATYSPYQEVKTRDNTYDRTVKTKGGGGSAELELAKGGPVNWILRASYVHSDSSRDSDPLGYNIPSNVCSSSSCSIGGNGDLDQTQDTYVLAFKAAADLGPGTLRGGFEYERVEANRNRPETSYAYSRSITADEISEEDEGRYDDGYGAAGTILCDVADPLTCVEGQYATHQYSIGAPYDVDVALDSVSAWAEYDVTVGDFDLRAGLRYDYESFLSNHDFAPRLAATWNLPGEGNWQLTVGANRYYGKSMLAYAIREAYPNSFIYRRRGTVVGDDVLFSDGDWYLYRETQPASYSTAGVDTPYSDELTAAIAGSVFGGRMRLKGIYRWGKDEFSSSVSELLRSDTATGGNLYRSYTITNDGRSTYKGVSFEWVRTINQNHALALNANYSKTKTNNANYFETINDLEYEDEFVLLDGEIVSETDILRMNRSLDYSAPFIANATWTAKWLKGRMTTNLNLRYTSRYHLFEDSLVNERVDGVSYDVYNKVTYRAALNVNLNVQADLMRTRYGTLTADLRLGNILNLIPSKEHASTTYPYQYGRQAWAGLQYTF